MTNSEATRDSAPGHMAFLSLLVLATTTGIYMAQGLQQAHDPALAFVQLSERLSDVLDPSRIPNTLSVTMPIRPKAAPPATLS